MPSLSEKINAKIEGTPFKFGESSEDRKKRNMWDRVLPPLLKQSYNESITGMVHQMTTGKKRFNMPMYEPGLVKDITASLLSFLMPIDLATVVVPGGLALKAVKSTKAVSRTSKILQTRGGMDKKVADRVAKSVASTGAMQSAALGTYEGLYEAMKAGTDEISKLGIPLSKFEAMDREKILGEMANKGMKAFGKGAVMGEVLGLARGARFTELYGAKYNPLKKFKGTTEGALLNEAAAFGTVSPVLYEGRMPTFTDYAMAGAVIGGLSIAPKLAAAPFSFGAQSRKNVKLAKEEFLKTRSMMDDKTAAELGINNWEQFLGSSMVEDRLKFASEKLSKLGATKEESADALMRIIVDEAHASTKLPLSSQRAKSGEAKAELAIRKALDPDYDIKIGPKGKRTRDSNWALNRARKSDFFKGGDELRSRYAASINESKAIYVTKERLQRASVAADGGGIIRPKVWAPSFSGSRKSPTADYGMFRLGTDTPRFAGVSGDGTRIYLSTGEKGVRYALDKTNTRKYWLYHTGREDLYQQAFPKGENIVGLTKTRNAIGKQLIDEAAAQPEIYGEQALMKAIKSLEQVEGLGAAVTNEKGKTRYKIREAFDVKYEKGGAPGMSNKTVFNVDSVKANKKFHKLTDTQKEFMIHHLENQKHNHSDYLIMEESLRKNMLHRPYTDSSHYGPISSFFSGARSTLNNVENPLAKMGLQLIDLVDGGQNALSGYNGNKLRDAMHFSTLYRKGSRKYNDDWYKYINGDKHKHGRSSFSEDMRNRKFDDDIGQDLLKSGKKVNKTLKSGDKAGHKKALKEFEFHTLRQNSVGKTSIVNGKTVRTGVRGHLDDMWAQAEHHLGKSNLAPKEDFYFPFRVRKEIFSFMADADKAITTDMVAATGNKTLTYALTGTSSGIDFIAPGTKLAKLGGEDAKKVEKVLLEYLNGIRTGIQRKLNPGSGKKPVPFNQLSKKEQEQAAYLGLFDSIKRDLKKDNPNVSNREVFFALRQGGHNETMRPMMSIEKKRGNMRGAYEMIDINKAAARAGVGTQYIKKGLADVQEALYERNSMVVLNDYVNQHASRMMQAKYFGRKGEKINAILQRIPTSKRLRGSLKMPEFLGGAPLDFVTPQTERDALQLSLDVITNKMALVPTSTPSEILQKWNNLEMAWKINSGFASLLNVAQTFISTANVAGFWRTVDASYKHLLMDPKKRKLIDSVTNNLQLIDEVMGGNTDLGIASSQFRRESTGVMGQFVDSILGTSGDRIGAFVNWTGSVSGFNAINRINSLIAGATAEKLLLDMGRTVSGRNKGAWGKAMNSIAPEQRKAWGAEKLRRMGVNIDSKNKKSILYYDRKLGKQVSTEAWMKDNQQEVLRVMQKFAADTQLKRSFTRDPILFYNQNVKPLLIFKRFGYRQPSFIYDNLKQEFLNGNVVPVLSLGMAGLAGGQFVLASKEWITQALTGEEQFTTRNRRAKLLKEGFGDLTFDKYLNGVASVGAFGMLGELVSDEDPMRAVSFFVKPVVLDDIQKIGRTFTAFRKSAETHYPDGGLLTPAKAGIRTGASIVGGYPARLAKRIETPKQEKDRIRQMKRNAIVAAKDQIMGGYGEEAASIVDDFNRTWSLTYPSLRIAYSDFSIKALLKDYDDLINRRKEEYEYRP